MLTWLKNKKHLLTILLLTLSLLAAGFFVFKTRILTPRKVHYHAGFVIFKDGKKIDFSDFKYMRVKPCNADKNHEDSDEDIQNEKAHLHDLVGDVVHVEAENAYWKDLFTNINYRLDHPSTTSYINGNKIENFENLKIQPYDSLVILIGKNKNNHLKDAVKKEYIEEKAKKSVECD